MTFPMNYNLTNPKKENISCVQCKKEIYDLGIEEVTTPGGNAVRAYSVERTLCDILKPHSHVDIQVVTEVKLISYMVLSAISSVEQDYLDNKQTGKWNKKSICKSIKFVEKIGRWYGDDFENRIYSEVKNLTCKMQLCRKSVINKHNAMKMPISAENIGKSRRIKQ